MAAETATAVQTEAGWGFGHGGAYRKTTGAYGTSCVCCFRTRLTKLGCF
jgi:hypothetical protein